MNEGPRLPVNVYPTAILRLDEHGLPTFEGATSEIALQGPVTIAFRDGRMLAHYFHFLEMLLAAFVTHAEYFPDCPVFRLLVGWQVWSNPEQNHVQADLLRATFGRIEVVEGERLVGERLDNVVVFDRYSVFSPLNKFLEPFHALGLRHAATLRERVWAYAPATDVERAAAHVARKPPRAFSTELAARIEARIGGEAVDFASISWLRQVAFSRACNLLYGVHGNGLTNAIWMRPGSTLLEFFPAKVHVYDYQMLSEFFGLRYFGFQDGNVWRDFTRMGGPLPGSDDHVNFGIDDIDWPALEMALASLGR